MESLHTPDNWSAAADDYDEVMTSFTRTFADAFLEHLGADASHEVIEVAAGPGAITLPLATRCRRVLATDYADGMVAKLQQQVQASGLTNVECATMDGEALDVPDASFDRAISAFGLMLFHDRAAGFRELRRGLRPGGRAVVTGWSPPPAFEPFVVFGQAVRAALPDMPAPPGPPPVFSLGDPNVFQAEMEAAGFEDVRIEHVTRNLEMPNREAFWSAMRGGAPPARRLFATIGEENVERVRDALYDVLTPRFGDGPISLSTTATVGVGTAPA